MKKYMVDLHRLRHNPYNGLYTFSCRLAEHLILNTVEDEQLTYYLPKDKFGMFGDKPKYVGHKRWHKFFQPGTGQYDVWHLTTGISQYRPFNKTTKVIYTIHDMNFLVEDAGNSKYNKRSLKLMQKNVNQASHIVGISEHALNFAANHLDFGSTATSVIYNGSSVAEFPGFDKPVYKPVRPFLFSLGLVQPRKNLHVLPALLVSNEYELVIAGLNNFDYKERIIEEAKKYGVEDRVNFVGPIDEKTKYWYYKNCEAFMFPSFAEGFGAPPLEAMQFGKPVFLSRFMSLPEIGGDAAYYFDDFEPDTMRTCFNTSLNDYRTNDRVESIKRQASWFNWHTTAKQYLDIYRSVLQS